MDRLNTINYSTKTERIYKSVKHPPYYICIRDESLDFKEYPAGEGVNAIHSYPAMFHPRLVRWAIEKYSRKGDLILDPFVGSGVSAVESSISDRKFIGFDINPLALLISRVRTNGLKTGILLRNLSSVLDNFSAVRPSPQNFSNIDFWFSKDRIESLSKLLTLIESLSDNKIQVFYKVVLSETIRVVSLTKPHEFKLTRRQNPCPTPTLEVFKKIALKNIDALSKFYAFRRAKYKPIIQRIDLLKENLPLKDETVSLVVTSPPYGDSQTTVAYGQFSRLPLQWLNLEHTSDKESLGAKPVPIQSDLPSEYLYQALESIQKSDSRRAQQVYSFYRDLFTCMKKVIEKVKFRGYLVFVVGNRTVKGVQLPTDKICSELLHSLGCDHLETRFRLIGNKRMPSKNSPTNIPGEKSATMKYEYVVICRRSA